MVKMMSVLNVEMAGVEAYASWVVPHIPHIPRPVRNQAHPIVHPVGADAHAGCFLYSCIVLASFPCWESFSS